MTTTDDVSEELDAVAAEDVPEPPTAPAGSVAVGAVEPFAGLDCADKALVLQILEEAAEVYGAWQYDQQDGYLVDEIADCIQACANLAAALGVTDLRPPMERCRQRNEERGRY